jgi:hypothetical protein
MSACAVTEIANGASAFALSAFVTRSSPTVPRIAT